MSTAQNYIDHLELADLKHLPTERAAEPERIKQRHALRGVRVFPLGVLYLLPETTLRNSFGHRPWHCLLGQVLMRIPRIYLILRGQDK